jgi:hypothetical protein
MGKAHPSILCIISLEPPPPHLLLPSAKMITSKAGGSATSGCTVWGRRVNIGGRQGCNLPHARMHLWQTNPWLEQNHDSQVVMAAVRPPPRTAQAPALCAYALPPTRHHCACAGTTMPGKSRRGVRCGTMPLTHSTPASWWHAWPWPIAVAAMKKGLLVRCLFLGGKELDWERSGGAATAGGGGLLPPVPTVGAGRASGWRGCQWRAGSLAYWARQARPPSNSCQPY